MSLTCSQCGARRGEVMVLIKDRDLLVGSFVLCSGCRDRCADERVQHQDRPHLCVELIRDNPAAAMRTIEEALLAAAGNCNEAAELLGISRSRFWRWRRMTQAALRPARRLELVRGALG
jgi:transcriptional regulator with PAS, ATPase and Fis domain